MDIYFNKVISASKKLTDYSKFMSFVYYFTGIILTILSLGMYHKKIKDKFFFYKEREILSNIISTWPNRFHLLHSPTGSYNFCYSVDGDSVVMALYDDYKKMENYKKSLYIHEDNIQIIFQKEDYKGYPSMYTLVSVAMRYVKFMGEKLQQDKIREEYNKRYNG